MLTILLGSIITIGTCYTAIFYRTRMTQSCKKYRSVVRSYQSRYPDMYLLSACIKAFMLIMKCKWISFYQSMTSVSLPNCMIVKYVIGGEYHYHMIPTKRGPRDHIEYGYIDEIQRTDFIQHLAGPRSDFYGHPECLSELGNRIRYKITNQDEKIIEKVGDELQKKENLKKILNFYSTS